jgi:hypothetical protein
MASRVAQPEIPGHLGPRLAAPPSRLGLASELRPGVAARPLPFRSPSADALEVGAKRRFSPSRLAPGGAEDMVQARGQVPPGPAREEPDVPMRRAQPHPDAVGQLELRARPLARPHADAASRGLPQPRSLVERAGHRPKRAPPASHVSRPRCLGSWPLRTRGVSIGRGVCGQMANQSASYVAPLEMAIVLAAGLARFRGSGEPARSKARDPGAIGGLWDSQEIQRRGRRGARPGGSALGAA